MDSIKSQLEMLSEDAEGNVNYKSWIWKLELTLKYKKLYDVESGITVRPDGQDTDANVKAWLEKDLEAQAYIGLNVSSNIAKKMTSCKTANSMLDKLKTFYGKKSDHTVEGLQRKFFSFEFDEAKSAIENCMIVLQYADDLEAEGETVKETWIMTRILSALPRKLHHFRTAWEKVNATDKNLKTLFERLRLEESRLNGNKDTDESASQNALLSRNSERNEQSQYV